jgi:hypothetical protein
LRFSKRSLLIFIVLLIFAIHQIRNQTLTRENALRQAGWRIVLEYKSGRKEEYLYRYGTQRPDLLLVSWAGFFMAATKSFAKANRSRISFVK